MRGTRILSRRCLTCDARSRLAGFAAVPRAHHVIWRSTVKYCCICIARVTLRTVKPKRPSPYQRIPPRSKRSASGRIRHSAKVRRRTRPSPVPTFSAVRCAALMSAKIRRQPGAHLHWRLGWPQSREAGADFTPVADIWLRTRDDLLHVTSNKHAHLEQWNNLPLRVR